MKQVASNNSEKKDVPAKDVNTYLAAVPHDMQIILENLRKTIKDAAPMAEESISYRIPTYKYHGPLVHFVARKNYCSFIVVNKSILETLKSELEDYDISGTTIHFTPDKPLPSTLVQKIVKARIEENEQNNQKKRLKEISKKRS